jgi:uncharacterized membrane protein
LLPFSNEKENPMKNGVKLLGHPVHPMLVVFPLGLLPTAVFFDVVHLATDAPRWAELAFWMIAAGIVGALAAAVFGWLDWFAIPSGTRAKRIGLWHGLGNVVVVGLFAASWILRYRAAELPSTTALLLSFAGIGLALVTGWLGGELVDRLGVGVDEGANVNAPSSLGDRSRPGGFPGTAHPARS